MGSSAFCLASVHHLMQLVNPQEERWVCSNEIQRHFFATYGEAGLDVASLGTWLSGTATVDADELRTWLADRGWSDEVAPIPRDSVAVASVFDLLVDWKRPASESSIRVPAEHAKDGTSTVYRAVEMEPLHGVRAYRLAGHATPMFEIETRSSGWKVFLVEATSACAPLDLTAAAIDFLGREWTSFEFAKLRFPAIEMRADVDVSWMKGLGVEKKLRITDARKKISLRVDEWGAHARSATRWMVKVFGIDLDPPPIYEITTPFLVIFWREGLRAPAFVALSDTDSWLPREPG